MTYLEMGITSAQTRKITEMVRTEMKNFVWDVDMETDVNFIYYELYGGRSSIIHWFELCFAHLAPIMFGTAGGLIMAEMWSKMVNGSEHPVDFLYKFYCKGGKDQVEEKNKQQNIL